MENKNSLRHLFLESEAYSSLEAIEELLQQGMELHHHPIQPLYICLKSMMPELAGTYLDRFSVEQRQVMIDLDLWNKDQVSVQNFNFWFLAYVNCPNEEVRLSFVKSEQFLLWLKGRINIWSFDVEEPEYPDHDNYFLTDDMLLLIEFDEDFPYVDELRRLIRELYGELGVEKAYTFLFKMVADSFVEMEEEEYRLKNSRMSDYGFVDYYDALSMTAPLQKIELIQNLINKASPLTGRLDELAEGQTLHANALSPYKSNLDSFFDEIQLLEDEQRKKFLNFDFIRLVNATITLDNALQAGPVALSKVGRKSNTILHLGMSYLKQQLGQSLSQGLFSRFIFSDLYKVGASLIYLIQRDIKRELAKHQFTGDSEAFLGGYWSEFIELSFDNPSRIKVKAEIVEVDSAVLWNRWKGQSDQLIALLPFISQIATVFADLRKKGQLLNPYYLNYTVEEMDIESILISQFARKLIGEEVPAQLKLGLTPHEVRLFFKAVLDDAGHLRHDAAFNDHLKKFVEITGMTSVPMIIDYLRGILSAHLEGYQIDEMADSDFTHIGGVIILDTLKQ